jgi:hypothetical protein
VLARNQNRKISSKDIPTFAAGLGATAHRGTASVCTAGSFIGAIKIQ